MIEELFYGIRRHIASKRLSSIILESVRSGDAVLTENKDGISVKSKYTLTTGSFLTRNTKNTISIIVPGGYSSAHGVAVQVANPFKAWDKSEYYYVILEMTEKSYFEVRNYFERQQQISKVNV